MSGTITGLILSNTIISPDSPPGGTQTGTITVVMSDGRKFEGTLTVSDAHLSQFTVVPVGGSYTIAAVNLDDAIVAAGLPSGTLVGNLNVTLSNGAAFVGTLTVNDTAHFAVAGKALVTSASLAAGNYPVTVTANDPASTNHSLSAAFQIVAQPVTVQPPGPLTSLASPSQTTSSITVGWAAPTAGGPQDTGAHQIQYKAGAASTWIDLPSVRYCTPSRGSIADSFGNVWTINPTGSPNAGQPNAVMCNGAFANGWNATLLYLVGSSIYHLNTAGAWYSFTLTGTVTASRVAWTNFGTKAPITTPGVTLSGLIENSPYNVRGYATNSGGQGLTSAPINQSTKAAAGDTVPPQAAAEGYNTAIIDADFSSASQVSSNSSGNTIAKLYAWNNFETAPIAYTVSNGVLAITQATGWGWGISTACSSSAATSLPTAHGVNTGRGIIFRYGYFEADIGWDWTNSSTRTFWMNNLGGTALELDIMELFGQPASAIHEWATPGGTSPDLNAANASLGGPQSAIVKNTTAGQIAYNKFGFLWTPSFMQVFFNDKAGPRLDCNQSFGWYQFGTNPGHNVATGSVNVFGGANRGWMLPQMGTWGAPQYCRMFRIWQ